MQLSAAAGVGGDHALDQRIDYRIGDPAHVLRALDGGRIRRKKVRSDSPGVFEKPNRCTMMSKSKSSTRFRYCTGSTIRKLALIPSVPDSSATVL